MNLFGHFQAVVRTELSAMMAAGELTPGLDFSRVTAEPPRDASHGDVTTNAAMVVALSGTIIALAAKGDGPASLKNVVSRVLSKPVPRLEPTGTRGADVSFQEAAPLRTAA